MQQIALVIGALLLGLLLLLIVITPAPLELPAQTASVSLPSTETLEVAVLPFWGRDGYRYYYTGIEAQLRSGLETELVNRAGVKVFSRERLDALIQEQGIEAGALRWEDAQKIAKLVGVGILIAGEIVQYNDQVKHLAPAPFMPPTAIERHLTVQVRVQLLDTKTGQVLKAKTLSAMRSKTQSGREPSSEELLEPVVQELSVRMADEITGDRVRELRYDLYEKIRRRDDGWVGISPSDQFTPSDREVVLLIYAARVKRDDLLTISWKDSQGNVADSSEVRYTGDRWIVRRFSLAERPAGLWTVEASLNGVQAFVINFTVTAGSR